MATFVVDTSDVVGDGTMNHLQERRDAAGFFCSTSGSYFQDKESLAEHYKSDFHRYNLKRKVAGLPPVTKEWFDARKQQLAISSSAASATPVTKVWLDPLSKKKFLSESTFATFTRSKKYIELVRKSGAPAPEPVVYIRREEEPASVAAAAPGASAALPAIVRDINHPAHAALPKGFGIKKSTRGWPSIEAGTNHPMEVEEGSEEGWETASEEEETGAVEEGEDEESSFKFSNGTEQEPSSWEKWDVRMSLLDNHMAVSFEANLEYMFKTYGFYFPDAEFCTDPEGLLQYLGSKLQYGLVPLYAAGDNTSAKQYRTLHAVQRHMVDTQQCKMLFDDNEEEYYDYYNYEGQDEDAEGGNQLALADGESGNAASGFELVIPSNSGSGTKILGSREFARYYRQGHRHVVRLDSVVVNTMLAKYRALGIMALHGDDTRDLATKKAATLQQNRYHDWRIKTNMGVNVNASSKRANIKLPKNVTY